MLDTLDSQRVVFHQLLKLTLSSVLCKEVYYTVPYMQVYINIE